MTRSILERLADEKIVQTRYKAQSLTIQSLGPVLLQCLSFLEQHCIANCHLLNRKFTHKLRELQAEARGSQLPVWHTLHLSSSARCTETLQQLPEMRPQIASELRHLTLEFSQKLRDSHLDSLQHYPKLRSFSLNGCHQITDSGVTISLQSLRKLRKLQLYWMPQITDVGLESLAEHSHKHKISHLSLSGVKHVSQQCLSRIVNGMHALQHLDLTRCDHCSDEALTAVAQNCTALQSLLLYAVPAVKDDGIIAIAQRCPSMLRLDLTGCAQLTDAAINAIARGCPQLIELRLQWCLAITNASLTAIGAHCRHLRLLSVHGCKQVTQSGLENVAIGCPDLRTLDVNGLRLVPDRSRAAMQKLFPALETLLAM